MNKRKIKNHNPKHKTRITPVYIFFYILFLPDTYRVLLGMALALLLAPLVIEINPITGAGWFMIYLMLATIGYAVTGKIGDRIAKLAKNAVLKNEK